MSRRALIPATALALVLLCGFNVAHPNQDQNSGFFSAFIASFLLILGSEVGDKTFFIAAIMSMKHSHTIVFGGAISALILMTALSAGLGMFYVHLCVDVL